MPPKSRPPVPIDRPLSKAYLREFAGWSTNFPPSISEPNSLRVMENVQITREGAARVRPGLRSYLRTKSPWPLVGSHELFYVDNGKAYLVAVRETVDVGTDDEREIVGFRCIVPDAEGQLSMVTLAEAGFDVPADPNTLAFTQATTYVKYLQIDNKIFALSNAPEGMIMFWVGTEKKVKKLQSIDRPAWSPADKLTAMHPTAAWVTNNLPSSSRTNLCTNPEFEQGLSFWHKGSKMSSLKQSAFPSRGAKAAVIESVSTRENFATQPLHNVPLYGITGWRAISGDAVAQGASLRLVVDLGKVYGYVRSYRLPVPKGARMRFAFDMTFIQYAKALRAWVTFYRADGDKISTKSVLDSTNFSIGRKRTDAFTIPTQAVYARIQVGVEPSRTNAHGRVDIQDVNFYLDSSVSTALNGDQGADYFWIGAPNASRSVYHPPTDAFAYHDSVAVTPGDYVVSADMHNQSGKQIEIEARAVNSTGSPTLIRRTVATGTNAYVRHSVAITVPTGSTRLEVRTIIRGARRPDDLRVDSVMIERTSVLGSYFFGATPNSGTTKRRWLGKPHLSASIEEVWNPVLPVPQVPADGSLVSSNQTKNRYSFNFFYTISNELGESAASQVSSIKAQRAWTAWQFKDPSGNNTDDPKRCADQLTVTMPAEVFAAAVAAGATHWTAYYWNQGPNDAPSVTATRFAEVDLTNEPLHAKDGYARLTPQMVKIGTGDPLIPSESTRHNASDPVKGSNGIVAADRLILVGNPNDPARISWSSGAPGDYHNFSTLLGGGTKQLTSGNLYTTAAVKLWQNPQSVDTLTILNMGDDGRSNAYYMQPANITSMSESISVMGFEEVTGTQGTVSPYGCEVANNALYRPLYHGLYKSTANNYNISTKSVTDSIQNVWRTLQSMHRIVSAQLDNRIYYLVHNIEGETKRDDCRGNEVWVLDLAATTPTWSRWKVQGTSLRAMDVNNIVMMSIITPDGIFTFNEDRYTDERFNADTGELEVVNIPWYLETNIQGANRAHDAWANLQQANIMVGNFLGQMRYGIRGQDVNGQAVDLEKVVLSSNPPPPAVSDTDILEGYVMPTLRPTMREDYLLVRKHLKEWVFYAGSVETEGVTQFSGGQVNAVQYRYTPATVNVGYEFGSVETFEYGAAYSATATTDSGTPQPFTDMSRA